MRRAMQEVQGTLGMRATVSIILASILSACSTVEVYVEREQDVKISHWPLGVHIQGMPGARGMRVKSESVGLSMGCGAYVIGAASIDCIFVDPTSCGLAIWEGGEGNELLIEANRRTFEHCAPREVFQ